MALSPGGRTGIRPPKRGKSNDSHHPLPKQTFYWTGFDVGKAPRNETEKPFDLVAKGFQISGPVTLPQTLI